MAELEKMVVAVMSEDDPTEFNCASSDRAGVTHKQSLRAYRGNGFCSCEFFSLSNKNRVCFEELLRLGYTPERAVVEGRVKLKEGQRIEDALRCKHLMEARWQFADVMVGAIDRAKRSHEKENPY